MIRDDMYMEPEIKEFLDFMNDNEITGKSILTAQKIDSHFEELGNALNTLIVYPDLFVDLMTPTESSFGLFFFQRIIIRSNARHKQVYTVATRAASKSFLAYLSRYMKAMQAPRETTFICMEIKEQAASVTQEKVNDLWHKFPLLKGEMIKSRQAGGHIINPIKSGKGYATYTFTNGSIFDVISVDNVRGGRRTSGLIEEVIDQDVVKLNEKVLPLMNVSRRTASGIENPYEPHAAQLYVTTAGYKNQFAYSKFLESLCYTAIDPDKYMTISLTYRIPLFHGLLDQEQMRQVISSPSFSKDSFDREYGSIWSGEMKGAAFSYNTMRRVRKVVRAEQHADKNLDEDTFYVVSADMAKDGGANTAVVVLKVTMGETHFVYKEVNAFKLESTNYFVVGDQLKQTVIDYNARLLIYDANGIGAAIRDHLNKPSFTDSGVALPGFGIMNPPTSAEKDLIRYNKKDTICYEIKAGGNSSSDINYLFFAKLNSGFLKMLIPNRDAIERYSKFKKFALASTAKKRELLKPYQFTDILEEELLNLDVKETMDGGKAQLKVERRNKKKIQKDFFSAISYGIWGVYNEIEAPYYKKRARLKFKKSQMITMIDPSASNRGRGHQGKVRQSRRRG